MLTGSNRLTSTRQGCEAKEYPGQLEMNIEGRWLGLQSDDQLQARAENLQLPRGNSFVNTMRNGLMGKFSYWRVQAKFT